MLRTLASGRQLELEPEPLVPGDGGSDVSFKAMDGPKVPNPRRLPPTRESGASAQAFLHPYPPPPRASTSMKSSI